MSSPYGSDARHIDLPTLRNIAEAEGRPAAAFLVRSYRSKLKQGQRLVFKIPQTSPLPIWFAVAMIILQDMPTYTVEYRQSLSSDYYFVTRKCKKSHIQN